MMLDHDEKRLHNLFSQIPVDIKSLEMKVEENMNKNLREAFKPTPRRKASVLVAASLLIMLFVAGTVYAATGLGVFDRFITAQDPVFGDIVDPIEIAAEVHGIRTEIIAAQHFAGTTIVYLSVQDVSGQNRLSSESRVFLNFNRSGLNGGTSGSSDMMSFDATTNTAYFQAMSIQFGSLDYVKIDSITINFDDGTWFSEPLTMPTSVRQNVPVLPMPGDNYFVAFPWDNIDIPQWILEPALAGQFPELPYSLGRQWISGIDIVEGFLHVQMGMSMLPDDTSVVGRIAYPELTTPSGDVITPWGNMSRFFTNADLQPIHLFLPIDPDVLAAVNTARMAGEILEDVILEDVFVANDDVMYAPYMFTDIFFPVNINELELYSLNLAGTCMFGVNIDLGLIINLGSDEYIRTIANDMPVGDVIVESVAVTPLGIHFSGRFEPNQFVTVGTEVVLETTLGNIDLGAAQGLFMGITGTFNCFVGTGSVIDVDSVVAVVIDGVRIVFN